jgi:hypothetical protein
VTVIKNAITQFCQLFLARSALLLDDILAKPCSKAGIGAFAGDPHDLTVEREDIDGELGPSEIGWPQRIESEEIECAL